MVTLDQKQEFDDAKREAMLALLQQIKANAGSGGSFVAANHALAYGLLAGTVTSCGSPAK